MFAWLLQPCKSSSWFHGTAGDAAKIIPTLGDMVMSVSWTEEALLWEILMLEDAQDKLQGPWRSLYNCKENNLKEELSVP